MISLWFSNRRLEVHHQEADEAIILQRYLPRTTRPNKRGRKESFVRQNYPAGKIKNA